MGQRPLRPTDLGSRGKDAGRFEDELPISEEGGWMDGWTGEDDDGDDMMEMEG